MIRLRPYQRAGVRFLTSRNGILAWEPGVGKTLAALEASARVGGQTLYLCPANLRRQVRKAAAEHDSARRVQVIEQKAETVDPRADLVVASYTGAQDKGLFGRLFKREWGALVTDEGHALKNHDARRTQAVYGARTNSPGALFRRARFTWTLTGTPVLSSPLDIWTHYSRLFPFAVTNDEGDPLNRDEWIERFCTTRRDGFGIKVTGGKNLDELRELIAPFMDHVRSVDVLDLAPLTIDTIELTADGVLSRGAISPEARAQVERLLPGFEAGDDGALEELQESLSTERRLIATAKAPSVADIAVTELQGGRDKVMVLAHHVDSVKDIALTLSENGYHPAVYVGGMTDREKEHALTRFLTHDHCRAFVGNITAAGVGLDGLQSVCSRLLFAEADWLPGINDQCIRRLWRSGQLRPVHASFCALPGSIDEPVQTALTRRAKVIAQIHGHEDNR